MRRFALLFALVLVLAASSGCSGRWCNPCNDPCDTPNPCNEPNPCNPCDPCNESVAPCNPCG